METLITRSALVLPKKIPALVRPDAWPRPDHTEELTSIQKANEIMFEFALKLTPFLFETAERRIGTQFTGEVQGREGEDFKIGIDSKAGSSGKRILVKLCGEYDLPLYVRSEHGHFTIGKGKPELTLTIDDYDNSREYEFEADTPGHTVATIWDKNDNPITTIDGNVFRKHLIIMRNGINYFYNPHTKEFITLPFVPEVESIEDHRFAVASYDGSPKYSGPFHANLDDMNDDRSRDGLFHGKSGAHTYGQMAKAGLNGKGIMAYPIFREPITEALPGWPLAHAAGFKAFSVDVEDGFMREFKPNISFYIENPERYMIDRIPFLIVARTTALARQIRDYAFRKTFGDWLGFKGKEEFG